MMTPDEALLDQLASEYAARQGNDPPVMTRFLFADVPVVLFDTGYWSELLDWVKEKTLADGLVSQGDLDLLHVTDDIDETVKHIVSAYDRRRDEGFA